MTFVENLVRFNIIALCVNLLYGRVRPVAVVIDPVVRPVVGTVRVGFNSAGLYLAGVADVGDGGEVVVRKSSAIGVTEMIYWNAASIRPVR